MKFKFYFQNKNVEYKFNLSDKPYMHLELRALSHIRHDVFTIADNWVVKCIYYAVRVKTVRLFSRFNPLDDVTTLSIREIGLGWQ